MIPENDLFYREPRIFYLKILEAILGKAVMNLCASFTPLSYSVAFDLIEKRPFWGHI